MLETKKNLKSLAWLLAAAVFSRTDEYIETNGSYASHAVVVGVDACGWCVGGIWAAVALR